MLSAIFISATNTLSFANDETPTECSEVSEEPNEYLPDESTRESLLALLDDKNTIIANLTRQIQNQKLQLSYYLKKELSPGRIEAFSETCTPQASEDSLPLNLAINKFYRQMGIRTKLSQLHERMTCLDGKISGSLRDQEFVLRKIVNRLCELIRQQGAGGEANFSVQFGNFITDPLYVDLFARLLNATVNLRRRLDGFKICCDRLLIIEEERNNIVEQVYSTPIEQRTNCNYLVGIQMEKAELENEISRLLRKQETKDVQKRDLQDSLSDSGGTHVNRMLKKINSQAEILLAMTKEQKRKFEHELSKSKLPDQERVLYYIKAAVGCWGGDNKNGRQANGITTQAEISLCQAIKRELDDILFSTVQRFIGEKNAYKTERDKLQTELRAVIDENEQLKVVSKTLNRDFEQMRYEREAGFRRLREERDAYKSQVEDLQAIREAYAQLVEKQPKIPQIEREFRRQIDERDKRIFDLENELAESKRNNEEFRKQIADQDDQIVVLQRFMGLTRPSGDGRKIVEMVPAKAPPPTVKENRVRTPLLTCRKRDIPTKKLLNTSGATSNSKFLADTLTLPSGKALTCFKVYSQRNGRKSDMVKAMISTNREVKGNFKIENSSSFSVEFKFNDGDDFSRPCDELLLDEDELFKDCSNESLRDEYLLKGFEHAIGYKKM